ncbi:outer membrane beta-barrel domain-containing protein [Marinobacteraceae bacterium S3BR75-40.1]
MENWTQRILLAALVAAATPVSAAEDDRPLIEPDVRPQEVDESLIDTENFELGGFVGVMHIEDFGSSFLWGARVAYHLSESFFIESNVGFAEGNETSFEQLGGNVQLITDSEREYSFYNVNFGYRILPGEAYPTDNLTFNSNFYLVGGAGATEFAGDNRFTVNFGAGYQVLLNDSLVWHIGVREHLYQIDLLGEDKVAYNAEISSGLSVFF